MAKVEKQLYNMGRHTYLYVPKRKDHPAEVIHHLNEAGIVVLFAVGADIDTSVFAEDRTYYSDWVTDTELSVEKAVAYVAQVSGPNGESSTFGDFI